MQIEMLCSSEMCARERAALPRKDVDYDTEHTAYDEVDDWYLLACMGRATRAVRARVFERAHGLDDEIIKFPGV